MRQRRRIAAFGVCRDRSGRIMFARSGDAWELPGGRVGQGEHPGAAVVRGFAAQTGLAAWVEKVSDVVADLAVEGDEVVHTDRILYDVRVPRTTAPDGVTRPGCRCCRTPPGCSAGRPRSRRYPRRSPRCGTRPRPGCSGSRRTG